MFPMRMTCIILKWISRLRIAVEILMKRLAKTNEESFEAPECAEGGRYSAVATNDILKEIHHQVKNNLQMVSSLLRIQSRSVGEPGSKEVFKRGEERIQSMALVYDTLYRGDLISHVPLQEYLPEMTRQLVSSSSSQGRRPQATCSVDNLSVSTRLATHMGLLVNEILSHRLRQVASNKENLRIQLTLRVAQSGALMELCDNGPRADEVQGVSSVELQILDALVRQVQGVVQYDNTAEFRMKIAIPESVLVAA